MSGARLIPEAFIKKLPRDVIRTPSGGGYKSHILINRILMYGLIIRSSQCLLVNVKAHSTNFDIGSSSKAAETTFPHSL